MPRPKNALNDKNKIDSKEAALIEEIAPPVEYTPAETSISILEEEGKDPWTGLTERQRQIQLLKMRGLSQATIGRLCGGISQTMVCKELKIIREVHKKRGVSLDKEAYAGEATSFYEELLIKTMNLFHDIPKDNPFSMQTKLQAINTLANIKDKHTKLLLDLGIIDKASIKHEHTVRAKQSTAVDDWSLEKKQKIAEALLLADFENLEEPVPDESIVDAEVIPDSEVEDEDEE